MSEVLYLTIPLPPSINNGYMKPKGVLKYINGKQTAMGMLYETTEAKKYKKDMVKLMKQEIKKQNFNFKTKPHFVFVEWTFFFPATNNDSNNRYKCFVDSITELGNEIWDDDNISMMRDANIYYTSKEDAHVEIKIYACDRVGIFDNQEDYDRFIENFCSKCKSGSKIGQKGGCSVYKNAMESRIQENIPFNTEEERKNKKCLKFEEKKVKIK